MACVVAGTEDQEQLISRYCHHLRSTNADLWNQLSKISECAENIVIHSNSVSILSIIPFHILLKPCTNFTLLYEPFQHFLHCCCKLLKMS